MGVIDCFSRHVTWPLWSRRDDPRLPRFVRELERRQFDPPNVVSARQAVMLQRIIRHAVAMVPYYRNLNVLDHQQFPILTKQVVRERRTELLSETFRHQPLTEKKTSGSTGVPLRIEIAACGLAWKRATTLRSDEWSGWQRGQPIAKAWGNPEYRQFGIKGWLRNHVYERAIHLDTLKMDQAGIQVFIGKLLRQRPGLIYGHAHSVYLLAQYLESQAIVPPRPNGIITTAMILHDFQRKLIEEVFHCPVTNRYGCEEVSLIACECAKHQGLHVNTESVYVEILKDGQSVSHGQPGKVVITDLTNFAMPLIRYEVGDVASWAIGNCSCGMASPRLAAIEGREADYVITASGHMISGISLTENFATLVPGIAQLQIIQETTESFRFRIVRGKGFSTASEVKIAELVRERFGTDTQYTCEFVDAIPQEASGKYRFCISHVVGQAHPRAAA